MFMHVSLVVPLISFESEQNGKKPGRSHYVCKQLFGAYVACVTHMPLARLTQTAQREGE